VKLRIYMKQNSTHMGQLLGWPNYEEFWTMCED
jgi:hypothetical protein